MTSTIRAVAFDCFGTLLDFGDESFARAYGQICREQGIAVDGKTFYDKWMEVWRRLARAGNASDSASVGVQVAANQPGPLSEAESVPPHPEHHTPSAGRSRSLDGPLPDYRPYSEEWPEHFDICFEELGVKGDPIAAHRRLVELLCEAPAFPESRRAVEAVRSLVPVSLLSNADDDFLHAPLRANGLEFPVVVSSETARAYKPHAAIFLTLVNELGLAPDEVLYVGDSRLADIVGARNAGLRAAWINRKGALNRSLDTSDRDPTQAEVLQRFPPDFVIASLDELVDIIKSQA
jgi:2-haloalkanoic acid dehalogenase type II